MLGYKSKLKLLDGSAGEMNSVVGGKSVFHHKSCCIVQIFKYKNVEKLHF